MTSQIELTFDKPQVDLTHEETHILSLLRRGRENAISVKTLTASTNIPEVEVRAIVRHLIMEHGILIASIVSAPPGFYIAQTSEEIQIATKSLRHRGIMILVRAAKLQKISIEEVFNQGRIEWRE